MQIIVDGKRYDTETAEFLCQLFCHFQHGDFKWHDTGLYVTKKGAFFLAGEGGPSSMWAIPSGAHGHREGYGMKVLSKSEARKILEENNRIEELERLFAIEDA